MRIAIFTDYYLPTLGGVQTHIKAHREALEQAGHEVTIFCPLATPSNDAGIVRLSTSKYFKPDNFPFAWPPSKIMEQATGELSKHPVDVVHVHSDMGAALGGLLAARSLGIPTVQTVHGRIDVYTPGVLPLPSVTTIPLTRIHNHYIKHRDSAVKKGYPYTKTATARRMWRLMVSQANYADHVIVPSGHFAKKLVTQGVRKPLTVLSNGIEDSVLQNLSDVRPRTYRKDTTLKLMWCARVSPEKRPLQFLQAIRLLPKNLAIQVDIYGDGGALASVRRSVVAYGLQDRVSLHGGVSQATVLEAMRTHHLFVSTSYDFDNQPMVILEAIAAGLPVLYCDPDLGEAIPAAGSRLASSPAPQDIAASIEAIRQNPSSINQMSKAMLAARNDIAQTTYLQQLLDIYSSVAKKQSSHKARPAPRTKHKK